MKNIILTSILLLFFLQFGISQSEPRIKEYYNSIKYSNVDTFLTYEKKYYDYDVFGNLISEIRKYYNDAGTLTNWDGTFYEYTSNHLPKKESIKRYNPDVDLWITEEWIEYKYDLKNCLVEEIHIANIGGLTKRISYEVNDKCQWLFNYVETPDWWNDTLLVQISYEERDYYYDVSGDSAYLDRWNFHFFDEKENLIEYHYIFTQTQHTGHYESRTTIEYDQFNNPTMRKSYRRYSEYDDWDLWFTFNFYNEYDNNGFLIGKREELISSSSIANPNYAHTFQYKNSCEGIHEIINIENTEYGTKRIEEFIYEGINDCLSLEKINLEIEVYPNPSTGIFNITSPIFKTGNTEILVYSIDGKALLQKTEISRSSSSSIDLSLMQNGLYILQLRNGDHFVKGKIVIAK